MMSQIQNNNQSSKETSKHSNDESTAPFMSDTGDQQLAARQWWCVLEVGVLLGWQGHGQWTPVDTPWSPKVGGWEG